MRIIYLITIIFLLLISSLNFAFGDNSTNWFEKISTWHSKGLISNEDFVNSIDYLTKIGIIVQIGTSQILSSSNISTQNYSIFETFDKENKIKLAATKYGGTITFADEFELKPEFLEIYKEIGFFNKKSRSVVIVPTFTSSAYYEPGFYTHYRDGCIECLTVEIKSDYPLTWQASPKAVKIFDLLGYDIITDIDFDKNPEIIASYDKVILLHNEYVTRQMFDSIVEHPKVVYLYPNALYAEVFSNYDDSTITLVRGHNYPEPEISNGFDWVYDNTHPYEYDHECLKWEFHEINNGIMLNCYPEKILHENVELLKMIKDY